MILIHYKYKLLNQLHLVNNMIKCSFATEGQNYYDLCVIQQNMDLKHIMNHIEDIIGIDIIINENY